MRGLLASPLGFLIGVSLGALGGGGSILAVPALVYGAGQGPKAATATSLLLVGTAALVGMGAHHRAGRVRVGTGVMFGLAGIGGSLAGTAVNQRMDPDLLLLGFSLLILVAAWRMVTGCPSCTQLGEARAIEHEDEDVGAAGVHVSSRRRIDAGVALKILLAGTVVGFLTGLFGVGGGFVIVPALTLGLGFSMPDAIGTSLLIIAINSAVALGSRLGTSTIDWAIAVPFTIAAVFGVLTGKAIADRLDAKRSLRWFAALLLGVALYTGVQAGSALIA
jgi:uncharacterized membrane protein YfcA